MDTGCVMLNAVLVPVDTPAADANNWYELPGLSTVRSLNVATPLTGAAVLVPLSVAPGVPPVRARVIELPKSAITFPTESCACTCTAGVIALVYPVAVGCCLKPSAAAGPAVTSIRLDDWFESVPTCV